MAYPTKIATCCFCGTKAALVLNKGRHELSCSSCGAPLHNLKRVRTPVEKPMHRQPMLRSYPAPKSVKPSKKRLKKKRKSFLRHLAEEAFDIVEDIFD